MGAVFSRRCLSARMTLPEIKMSSVRRILIVKLSAMGDVIHALPVSAALGEAFPHVELTWAVEEMFAPLVTGNPYLNEVLTLPKVRPRDLSAPAFYRGYLRRLRAVRRRRFDMTLDLQGLTKSAVVAVAAGAPIRLAYHWLREAAGLVEHAVPHRPESVHVVEQYLDVARFLGARPKQPQFPFFIPVEDEAHAVALLHAGGLQAEAPFVTINPAAGATIKQWGAANYAALIDCIQSDLGLPVALVTADLAVAAQVRAAARTAFADLSGKTTLKQLGAVLSRSRAHICGDTGSGHLAAALGRPVVSLFGPTSPERVCPFAQRGGVLCHREQCHPRCDGSHHCFLPEARCLTQIPVAEALEAVAKRTSEGCSPTRAKA